MTGPTDDLQARLKELEENIRELRSFQAEDAHRIKRDRRLTWALRYGVLETIQIVIDVACAVVSRHNLGYPDSYAECLRILGRHNYLGDELTQRLVRAVGMRNVLVHEYLDVDDQLVLDALADVGDFEDFAVALAQKL